MMATIRVDACYTVKFYKYKPQTNFKQGGGVLDPPLNITGDGLQIMTYVRHLWPLSSERSLACHTYYDTRHPFIMVISENP